VSQQPIQAITFDFWRTLFFAKAGSRERFEARVHIIAAATGCSIETVRPVFEAVSKEFLRVHITEQRTPHPREAIPMLSQHLGRAIEPAAAARLVDEIAEAFRLYPPEMIPGALDAVRAAAEHIPVGVISDTGMTPGTEIRGLLDREGFSDHVYTFSFSDEVGVAKPQPAIFRHAASTLGVAPESILHIGDLEPTDVAGAINVGAHAGLFAGDNRRYVEGTRARHVFDSWPAFVAALPGLLAGPMASS
jgi:HAD superfamily hydrolase (TIGR01549 family)